MLNGIISRNKRGVRLHSLGAVLALACFAMAATAQTASPFPEGPKQDYLVYVVCESADKIVLLRFGPKGLQIENQARTGLMPMDINGPHGIAILPDRTFGPAATTSSSTPASGCSLQRRISRRTAVSSTSPMPTS